MATKNEVLKTIERPFAAVGHRVEQLDEQTYAFLLLVPTFLLLGVIALWPLFETFTMSLHADDLGAQGVAEWRGVQNYVEILSGARDPLLPSPFYTAVWVTFAFAFISVAFETLFGFAQALVLDQEFRFRGWVRAAIILPWAVPLVIQGMIFFLMFESAIGFATEPLARIGLLSSTTPLVNMRDSLIILMISDIWKTTAFMALLILAGLQSIDRSLYDVGRVAGASLWQRFRTITLPLVLPAVLVAMLFRTLQALQVYGVIVTMSDCRTVPSLTCMVVQAFRANRFASSATIAFITAAIIAFFIAIYLVKFVGSARDIGAEI